MHLAADKATPEELLHRSLLGANNKSIPGSPMSKVSGGGGKKKAKQLTKGQLEMIIPSFRKQGNSEGVDFKSIFRVFTDKHAKKLYSRQVDVLTKLLAIYQDGVPLNEISAFSELLNLLNVSIQNDIPIIRQTTELVKLLRYYPELASGKNVIHLNQMGCKELETTLDDAKNLISVVATLINTIEDDEFIHHATEAIYKISGGVSVDQKCVSSVKIQFKTSGLSSDCGPIISEVLDKEYSENSKLFLMAAEKSDAPVKLVESLGRTVSESVKCGILKCLRRLSKSNVVSATLANRHQLAILFRVLADNYEKDTVIFSCVEVLSNVLDDAVNAQIAVDFLGKSDPITILKNILDKSSQNAYRQVDKQRRNEILVLCNRILDLAPSSLQIFWRAGLTDLVYELLVNPKDAASVKRAPITNGVEDFNFTRGLISSLKRMLNEPACSTYLIQKGILNFCADMICFDSQSHYRNLWDHSQESMLQILTLGLLTNLIPSTAKEFRSISGPLHLVNFLGSLIESGNKIDKKRVDLYRIHVSLMRTCLLSILTLSESGPISKKILGQLNIFEHLLTILGDRTQDPAIWRKCLVISSSLCQGFKANRQIFGDSGGVPIVIPFLLYSSSNPSEREMIVLAAVECIWGTVCGNLSFEDLFIQNQGIFYLLDLLEEGSYLVRRHTFGCLLDLLENPNAVSHALLWRTPTNIQRGIEHLLISIWDSEEERLGVSHGENGELLPNIRFPLRGTSVLTRPEPSPGRPDNHPAIKEIEQNLKAKIYSIFCKLGIEGRNLDPSEKVKLSSISKYLDFKVTEVWYEITEELKMEGVRPISPDLDCINCVEKVSEEKIQGVIDQQNDILRNSQQVSSNDEKHFFDGWLKEFAPELPVKPKARLHKWRQSLWGN